MSLFVCVQFQSSLTVVGVPGHPVRGTCPPQGSDLGFGLALDSQEGGITSLSPWWRGSICGEQSEMSPKSTTIWERGQYARNGMQREKENQKNRWLARLTEWRIESRTGVRIHVGKKGRLTERNTTDLERCCFHQVSWASNEHLSFSSEGRVSVPCVLPVTHQWRVCVFEWERERERGPMCIGVTMVKPIYCTKMNFTLSPLFPTPITVLSLNPTCTIHDKDLHILILFRHVCTYFFGCFFFFIFFSFKGFVQGKNNIKTYSDFPNFDTNSLSFDQAVKYLQTSNQKVYTLYTTMWTIA